MSLANCQICGQTLYTDEVYSDPSQHLCVELDGPAVVKTAAVVDPATLSDTPTPEPQIGSQSTVHAVPAAQSLFTKDDLAEVGRLHLENEQLKSMMPTVEVAIENGQAAQREVVLASGNSVIVEVAVHSK